MITAYKTEIQPTTTQVQALLQHAGNARWAWNWGLHKKQEAWQERKAALDAGVAKDLAPKVPTAIDLHKELNLLKKLPKEEGGVPWMYEASKCAPQEALRNLDKAFQATFQRLAKGKKGGFPKFKARSKGIGGFRLTGSVGVVDKSITLPVVGAVRIKPGDHGYLPEGRYGSVSVTEHACRWFVSVTAEAPLHPAAPAGTAVGIDLGVAHLATLSDGTVYENPKALAAALKNLRKRQKDVSRKKKGSGKRRKAVHALARGHRRVANVRKDLIHKATTEIADTYATVVVEDLNVKNMTKAAKGEGRSAKAGLNRSVLDASFSAFRRLLEYKVKARSGAFRAVPAAYTSQTCSACGCVEKANRQSQAGFLCVSCGFACNADLNAAQNILAAGSSPDALNARGVGVRPNRRKPFRQPAVKRESA